MLSGRNDQGVRASEISTGSSLLFGSVAQQPPENMPQAVLSSRMVRSCVGEFKQHQKRLKMFKSSDVNNRWPDVFGTSPWFPRLSPWLLVFRGTVAAIFVAMWIYCVAKSWQDGYWAIYLTHWSLSVETVYFLFATFTAWRARVILLSREHDPTVHGNGRLPWFVSVTWVLNHVEMAASLLVALLFWTTVNPIWNLQYVPNFLGFFVHGINFLLCLTDLFVGRNVFYLPHVLWFLAYAFLYLLFSLIHYWAKIGIYPTKDDGCDYPPDECPIYGVLNWHKPTATGIIAAIILLCIAPLCQFPLWWCVRTRRSADYFSNVRTPAVPEVIVEA
mmetsp:Transcript_7131/g.19550  ORF Transcript_7131/g.19550 Transcript_7131/m.19550 type:complete len:331 (-) Transcript_7131:411-1403(-)